MLSLDMGTEASGANHCDCEVSPRVEKCLTLRWPVRLAPFVSFVPSRRMLGPPPGLQGGSWKRGDHGRRIEAIGKPRTRLRTLPLRARHISIPTPFRPEVGGQAELGELEDSQPAWVGTVHLVGLEHEQTHR